MSAQRSEAFPQVPTLKELGLPDLEVDTWYGMFAPQARGKGVVAKLNAGAERLLKQSEIRDFLGKQGMMPRGRNTRALRRARAQGTGAPGRASWRPRVSSRLASWIKPKERNR